MPAGQGADSVSRMGPPRKAIILAGGDSTLLADLTVLRPKSLLPVLNRSLILSQIRCLARNGVREVAIALSPQSLETVSAHLRSAGPLDVQIHYAVDPLPRGPAGSLKLFESLIGDEPFFALEAGVYLGECDLAELARTHRSRRAVLTLGTLSGPPPRRYTRDIVMSSDGTIERVPLLHHSKERRTSPRFAGIYVFDPSVFKAVPEDAYFDIKEQLIPALRDAGARVVGEPMRGTCVPIDDVQAYWQAHNDLIGGGAVDTEEYRQVGTQIWAAEGASISSSAYVLGPVVLGRGCVVEDGAQVIGPTVVGDFSRIGKGSLARSSILWDGVDLADGARLEYSIADSSAVIPSDRWIRKSVVRSNERRLEVQPSLDGLAAERPGGRQWAPSGTTARVQLAVKHASDALLSAALLALSSPILLLCAVAIKLDSPGPVFYWQFRCGRNGKPFRMFKLRTMVSDADVRRELLEKRKDVQGPVFKLFHDPRITRAGRLLRKTSLDELPQLYNVLRGEMSLVGPRPLAADEMRCCPSWRDHRLSVKPGITGLWQVSGRGRAHFHDWIRHDVEYAKNVCLWLDAKILFRTLAAVIRGSGAY